jgi:flagellar hook-length control protein FliK
LNTAASTDSSAKTDALASSNANAANNAQASGLVNQSMPQGTPLAAKTLEIPVPVTSPQWGQQFSDHVIWMGNNDIKSAVIKIHPEDLGPIEISVKVVDNAASVNIVSHSAQVRDLVDQAMPRLRDMMSNQGLHLSDVQVSADKSSNQSSQNGYANNGQQEMDSDGTDDEVQLVTSVKKQSNRLVDYFA